MAAAINKGRLALKALPLILVPIAFLVSAPWLKTAFGGPLTTWVAAVTATFTMGYAWYLSALCQRGLDEVQEAGASYAAKWGVTTGQIAFFVLLALPPFQDFIGAVIRGVMSKPHNQIVLAMMFGACGVVLLQAIGTAVAHALWWKSKR